MQILKRFRLAIGIEEVSDIVIPGVAVRRHSGIGSKVLDDPWVDINSFKELSRDFLHFVLLQMNK